MIDFSKAPEREVIIREFVEDCFKHEGDIEETGYMWSLDDVEKHINEYIKPKKELVIPWEWLPEDVKIVEVDESGIHDQNSNQLRIKLDLTDIDLPVTVKRP